MVADFVVGCCGFMSVLVLPGIAWLQGIVFHPWLVLDGAKNGT